MIDIELKVALEGNHFCWKRSYLAAVGPQMYVDNGWWVTSLLNFVGNTPLNLHIIIRWTQFYVLRKSALTLLNDVNFWQKGEVLVIFLSVPPTFLHKRSQNAVIQ